MRYSYLCLASFLSSSEAFAFNPVSSSSRSTFSPPQQNRNNKSSNGGFGAKSVESLSFRLTTKGMGLFTSMNMVGGGDNDALSQTPTPPTVPYSQSGQQVNDAQLYYQAQLQAWQQQMHAYSQLIATNPEAASQMTPPPPPTPPMSGIPSQPQAQQQTQAQPAQYAAPQSTNTPANFAPKPPKEANKDSYEIANTADVYFAQLKRDSSVRTEARKAGDLETANAAFEDDGVKALKNYLSDDLIEKRRTQVAESGGEFETSRDEMIIPYEQEEEVDKTYSGVSYREKLQDKMRAKDVKVNTDSSTSLTGGQTTEMNSFFPKPQEMKIETPQETAPVVSREESEPQKIDTQTQGDEQSSQQFALEAKDENEIDMIEAPSMEDSEDTRRLIRTGMGLILKHRGGPGFGHGRLKSAEADRLTTTMKDVISLLKSESGMSNESSTIPSVDVSIDATSPDNIAGTTPAIETTSIPASGLEPLSGALTCVEAALNMYKNAPPNEQGKLLAPVRDALLSAATTINAVAEEWEVKEQEQKKDQVTPTSIPFPDYDATSEVSSESLVEDNTSKLQEIYESLKNIQGSGKYGLRELDNGEVRTLQ